MHGLPVQRPLQPSTKPARRMLWPASGLSTGADRPAPAPAPTS